MIYSRVLQVEHEQPKNEYGQGSYTVFNLIQPYKIDLKKARDVQIQTIAVLWNDQIDTRIIAMIERGLIEGVLSPVILLQTTQGILNVVHSSQMNPDVQPRFEQAWNEIAGSAWHDEWTTDFIRDSEANSTYEGGRIFRAYAHDILTNHELGVRKFTSEMFLHYEDWTPEKVFGSFPQEAGIGERKDGDLDFFDDDIIF
ncbi:MULTISPECIES: hypothetical protein [unclassified Pseudomonas]|uniref:hypothetical protein n=1 Tax=unclassified Pseudomonas TaxID=196821 RepID=UPI0021C5EB58|nr:MULTISPECIES: hypothetical protein [unclassified Pseudomonas]MCU1733846.1 hypothetical protein [Pseudomonas sp. 20P_3.2_Bac4]MCU1747424.1 hypothetical protein [Pseudomonas sp. 20P_3.2_Bac5]